MREFNPTGGARTDAGPGSDDASPRANALLRELGPDASAALAAAGRLAVLSPGQVLWRSGDTPETVAFPLSGVVAGLAADVDGGAAQVECVGSDSAAGLVEALAGGVHGFEYRAIVETDTWLVPAEAVRAAVRACPVSAEAFHRHIRRLYDDARRLGACAARHALRARLADCLLTYHEKSALTRLPLTQETLSAVLGANRTTVTALSVALSDAGLTRTGRGWISIVDRERLDRLACGCRRGATRRAGAPFPA